MIRIIAIATLLLASLSLQAGNIAKESIKQTVVKIFNTSITPDYFDPWTMLTPKNSSGTGVIIEGNRILTNAHVIANARFLQVNKYGEARKHPARVLYVSHDADLALITVDDEDFFDGIRPLHFSKLPRAQEQVTVLGYPFGGNSLSITQGVLSRIEHIRYAHNNQQLLAGQIDAAINPGNSGGPVIMGDRIVGIVMQTINNRRSENLGYMVPPMVIDHFLEDIRDKQFGGIPEIPVITQHLENPGMKRKFGFPEERSGILVSGVFDYLDNPPDLQEGDIITSIDGHDVADNHTVEFRKNERTSWKYFADLKQMGDTVTLGVFRNGDDMEVDIALDKQTNDLLLVDLEEWDEEPRYFIYGGMVFTPLTVNLAQRWGKDWRNVAPITFLKEIDRPISEEQREVVIALKVLASGINEGYHNYSNQVIRTVNGKEFRDFTEFAQLLQDNEEEFVTFRDENGFQLVIDAQQEKVETPAILEAYGVGAPWHLD